MLMKAGTKLADSAAMRRSHLRVRAGKSTWHSSPRTWRSVPVHDASRSSREIRVSPPEGETKILGYDAAGVQSNTADVPVFVDPTTGAEAAFSSAKLMLCLPNPYEQALPATWRSCRSLHPSYFMPS